MNITNYELETVRRMQPVIIIGLTCQGLSLLRTLSKAGLSVIAFTENKKKKEVGYYSKYGEKRLFSSTDDLKRQLLALAKEYHGNGRLKCLLASGIDLSMILRSFPEIYDVFDVEPSPFSTVDFFSHKNLCYDRCEKLGVPYAKYRLLSEYREGDLRYPLMLKKNYEIKTFFKTKIVRSEDEFRRFVALIPQEQYPDLVVQELIQLSTVQEVSCQMYVREGEIKVFLPVVQQGKLKKGLTSFLIEISDQEIRDALYTMCRRFFKGVQYTGFIEIEFLFDQTSRQIYFLETNPRPCGWHSAMTHKFPNLAEIYASPHKNIEIKSTAGTIRWVNIQRDLRVSWERKTFPNFYRLFASKHDVFDWKDLTPFFRQFVRFF